MESTPIFFPLLLTAKTCAASLLLFVTVGVPLAYWLAGKKTCLKRIIEFFVTLPLIFPPIALGYMLLIILGRNGWIGSILESLGFRIVFSQEGVILAAFIAGLPLVVKPLQAAFDSAEARELEEAAFVHGLNRFKTAVFVSIPFASGNLLAALLLGLARASGEVGVTMMIGGNIADRTNTLSLEIFNSVSRGDFDTATALCAILAGFAALICLTLNLMQLKKA